MPAARYTLRIPADPFTRHAFRLGKARRGAAGPDGGRREVRVGGGRSAAMEVAARGGPGGPSGGLDFRDLCVYGAVCAAAAEGLSEVPVARIMASLGYANPSAGGMKATARRLAGSIAKMRNVEVAMPAVRGAGGAALLEAVPRTAVIAGDVAEGVLSLACGGEGPLGALPLFSRAQQMRQVIGIAPQQMPVFSGRRASLLQRQIAVYVLCRALERGTGNVILMDTLFADLGVTFPSTDAGYHRRSRCLGQLEATLASMAERGTAIRGYELERRPDNSVRSVSIAPARRAVDHRSQESRVGNPAHEKLR